VTNVFADIYFANDLATTQSLQRIVTTPDILFQVRDVGGTVWTGPDAAFIPRPADRSDTSNWENHAGLNGRPGGGGPGVIRPPVHITLNNLGRYRAAAGANMIPEWAAFDDSPAPPVLFPGNETNINSLVVDSRLVRTNALLEFEWTTLRYYDFPYRIEVSTNLTNWTVLTRVEGVLESGNAFTLRQAVDTSPRYFRAIKESQ